MKFSVFQISRRGGREKNEDRMGYCYTRESSLFVLADGMGGHPEGEIAAQLALQTVTAYFQKTASPRIELISDFLSSALIAAHHQILRYASAKGMLDSPRTTLIAAVIENGSLQWAHCGDSRLYLVRNEKLLIRTKDHTLAERQPPTTQIKGEPVVTNRNILFTCLGSPQRPIHDISDAITLQQGDKFLLCSDGLWSSIDEQDIVRILSQCPVAQAIPTLVEMALKNAGSRSDNVTALGLEWETPNETTQGIVTDSVHDGVFESTIKVDLLDDHIDQCDLDDATIERSIAEINEAIRRTAQRKNTP